MSEYCHSFQRTYRLDVLSYIAYNMDEEDGYSPSNLFYPKDLELLM